MRKKVSKKMKAQAARKVRGKEQQVRLTEPAVNEAARCVMEKKPVGLLGLLTPAERQAAKRGTHAVEAVGPPDGPEISRK